jgi:hypothetical protein
MGRRSNLKIAKNKFISNSHKNNAMFDPHNQSGKDIYSFSKGTAGSGTSCEVKMTLVPW